MFLGLGGGIYVAWEFFVVGPLLRYFDLIAGVDCFIIVWLQGWTSKRWMGRRDILI